MVDISVTADRHAEPVSPPAGRRARRGVLGAQATALAAQTAGALQLLLLVRGGTNRSTDAYFVLLGAGQLVSAIWVLGVVYPRRLADAALSWRGLDAVAAVMAAISTVAAAGYLRLIGYSGHVLLPLLLALVVAAAASAAASCKAAMLACAGRPRPMAGLALVPNLFACLGLLEPWTPGSPALRMSVGLAMGSLALLPFLTVATRSVPTGVGDTAQPPGAAAGSRWLLYGSVIGNLAPVALQSALATLPGGRLTAFSVASRLALAATSVGLNSVLPLLVSWQRYDAAMVRRLCRLALVAAPAGTASACALAALLGSPHQFGAPAVVLLVAWAFVTPTTTLATQATVREGDLRSFRWTGSFNLLATSAGIGLLLLLGTLETAVATLLAVQVGVSGILFFRRGWHRELHLLVVSTLCALAVVVGPALLPVPLGFLGWTLLRAPARRRPQPAAS
jgi:hypothetical protein